MATIQDRCEYSSLKVPNHKAYVGVARTYVGEVAKKIGFDEEDRLMIQSAVAEAVTTVMEHAFEPDERATLDISCERVPLGLKIIIADQGLPFDPDRLSDTIPGGVSEDAAGPGISGLKESVEEVEFHNLGPAGKEIVLIKYLNNRSISEYLDACELEPYEPPPTHQKRISPASDITIRPMELSEALEVSKAVYRAYGNTYAFEHLYYPERIVELNQSGEMFSIVAVTPTGEIAGHLALTRHGEARIGELGRAVVKPEFRSMGIFTRLNLFALDKAKSEGLLGIFGEAVTNHTYSQQVGLAVGLRDCALFVGYLPQTEIFRKITEELPQRESLLVHFMYLREPPALTIYPPSNHKAMVVSLFRNLGASPDCQDFNEQTLSGSGANGAVSVTTAGPSGTARIRVERFGSNVFQEVKSRLRELCLKRFEIIHLRLGLSDPQTAHYCPQFEGLGFFFAGILPGTNVGDALILQYLNNVPIDYDKIKTKSQKGSELLAYIKDLDPNRI
jgi:anti-sigma regulatory factor (Ser/Thr protein kinase)